MSEALDFAWLDHPDAVPLRFSLTCKNTHKTYTYDYTDFDEQFLPIARAFAWSIVRRAHAVGHLSRSASGASLRKLQIFVNSIARHFRPRNACDISASFLREYAVWLKEKSGLSYRTASTTYRHLVPLLQQWTGQAWASNDLMIPQFMFPHSNDRNPQSPKKGYSKKELKDIATHVIADIQASNRKLKATYVPRYLGKPPPLEDVAPQRAGGNLAGSKFANAEVRRWWWENNCQCKLLSIEEIKGKKGAYSFLYGYWKFDKTKPTIKGAAKRLQAFYDEIGAGAGYKPRYIGKDSPIKYTTKWKKPEYLIWVWENECGCQVLAGSELRKTHNKLFVALREHHDGFGKLWKILGIQRRLTIHDLSPYYVGLLLSTALNPVVIQRLQIDCLVTDPLGGERESILWTKIRANKAGLSIPANGRTLLAPANIVRDLIEITKPHRRDGNTNLFLTNGRSRNSFAIFPGTFARAIARWFKSKGLVRHEGGTAELPLHAAPNFRPAIASDEYERTGSLQYVQSLLGHTRAETTVDYVGKLPVGRLTFHRGLHIEAAFIGAISGQAASRMYLRETRDGKTDHGEALVETTSAHCRDIRNSPFHGQIKGKPCSLQDACLHCANLVVTTSDITRHFAKVNYYSEKLRSGAIAGAEFEQMVGEAMYMYAKHILPKYDQKLVEKLTLEASNNPPAEYRCAK